MKRRSTILLVEDNPGDAELTIRAFQEAKFVDSLHHVVDGEAAIRYLENSEDLPKLILLDLNLPKKYGLQVLREIKENRLWKSIPIIVLTSSSARSDVLESYKLQANCFIQKPVDFHDYINVVKHIEEFWFSIVQLPTQ